MYALNVQSIAFPKETTNGYVTLFKNKKHETLHDSTIILFIKIDICIN